MLFSLIFCVSEAREFLVGGKPNSWQMPSLPSNSLNQWAEANRFHVGDSLVWKFDNEKDSVLVVTEENYRTCNTSNPVAAHKAGNVVMELDRSGPFYFISGVKGRCDKGEKLIVVVMNERKEGFFGLAPAPAPTDFEGPAVAPTSSAQGLVGVWRSGFLQRLVALGSLVGVIFF
ncbi:hypothetical protein ACLOJK_002653 [Asimina triloba]